MENRENKTAFGKTKALLAGTMALLFCLLLAGCQSSGAVSDAISEVDAESYEDKSIDDLRVLLVQEAEFQTLESMEEIYQFDLDGTHYSVPLSVSSLEEAGWVMVKDPETMVDASTCVSDIEMRKGNSTVYLTLCNSNESESQRLGSCVVIGVEVTSDNTTCDFSTAAGIALGDSIVKAAEAYGGTGHSESSYEGDFTSVEWNFYEQLNDAQRPQTGYGIFTVYQGTDSLTVKFDEETLAITKIEMQYALYGEE